MGRPLPGDPERLTESGAAAGGADQSEAPAFWERRGRTAVIFLNRPHRSNAWTGRLERAYRRCLAEADADPESRVIVVTGVGRRFCVGGDSQALEGHAAKGGYDRGLEGNEATPGYGFDARFDHPFASHYGLSKPIIAAVNGAAAGIGLALACFCDLRFADAGAKLTTAHGKLGLPPEYGLSWIIPRLIGLGRGMDVVLTSRVVLAEEALTLGLVNQVHPPDELLDATIAYAEQLAATVSPQALRASRQQVYLDQHRDVGQSVQQSMALLQEFMKTEEYREGVAALVEKRPPKF